MTNQDRMQRADDLLTHVWMVRTFIKHSDEAEEDDELREVQRVQRGRRATPKAI